MGTKKLAPFSMKELMYRLDGHKVDLMPYAVFAAHLFTAKNEWVDRIYTDKIVADYVSRESCNEYKKSAENKAQMTLDTGIIVKMVSVRATLHYSILRRHISI